MSCLQNSMCNYFISHASLKRWVKSRIDVWKKLAGIIASCLNNRHAGLGQRSDDVDHLKYQPGLIFSSDRADKLCRWMKIYQNHANRSFSKSPFCTFVSLAKVYESCKTQKWHLNQGTCLFVVLKPWCLYADSTVVHQKWKVPLFAGLCCIVYRAMNHKALSWYVLRC